MSRVLVNTVSLSGGALHRERTLLRALADIDSRHSYTVLCTPATREALPSLPDQFDIETVPQPANAFGRIVWENTDLPGRIRAHEPDILYFPLHVTGIRTTCPQVSAVRNAAPFCPEAYQGASLREQIRLRALRLATRHTIRTSTRVVFMSESTMERVAEYIPRTRKKAVVVPHGRPLEFEPREPSDDVLDRYGLPGRFLLSVSNITRYKNLVELVEGYSRATANCDLPPLCIAGKVVDDGYYAEIHERIDALELGDSVRFLGFVDRGDLPDLHAASEFFVFSSACENAPLSLIEALSSGSAIATSKAASMPELCGEAALYFDPEDPASIAGALERLAMEPALRTNLADAALERAGRFSWAAAANEMDKLFARV